VPRLFDEERVFRPNLAAERADQLGASLQLRLDRGMNPVGFRWGADLFVEGSTGTFDFVRPSLTLGATTPLPGRFLGAVEVAGGTAFGDLPVQSGWYLGGAGSVRGYAPLSIGGNAFWRARAEVSNALPGARLVLFSDAGWAGSRDDIQLDPALLSAGVGASFLDGLIRFDIARALRGERQWRAELYFNGNL
jgi:hemolysin activation/secretion protein